MKCSIFNIYSSTFIHSSIFYKSLEQCAETLWKTETWKIICIVPHSIFILPHSYILQDSCGNIVEKGNVEEYMNCSTFYGILPHSYSLQYSIKFYNKIVEKWDVEEYMHSSTLHIHVIIKNVYPLS